MISILQICWNRLETTRQVMCHNLIRVGRVYELLVVDNGSTEPVPELIEKFNPEHFRRNSRNEGVGKALNQLFLRAEGDYIAVLGNDILMPELWGRIAMEYADKMPNCGLIGFDWGYGGLPPICKRLGVVAHHVNRNHQNRVFGNWFFKRRLVEEIGFFHEGYGPYGIEDSDFNERVIQAGFNSFYIPDLKSEHLCIDAGEDSEYRRMKDESLRKNSDIFDQRILKFQEDGVREPLPPMREPL